MRPFIKPEIATFMLHYFIPCSLGLEELVASEIAELGATAVQPGAAGVHVAGDLNLGYRLLMWLRTGSRVLVRVGTGSAANQEALTTGAAELDWPAHFAPDTAFAVRVNGTNKALRHTQFAAQVVKDGVVQRFQQAGLARPRVQPKQPDLLIQVHINREQATFYLDLAGAGLHQRGYRQDTGPAPLRETLAATVLARSGLKLHGGPGQVSAVADPSCGSGTLLLEAALILTDRAPGLDRQDWGFTHWLQHQPEIWQAVQQQAKICHEEGLKQCSTRFMGADTDTKVLASADRQAHQLGLGTHFTLTRRSVNEPLADWLPATERGLLVTNPPYGERLGDSLTALVHYRQLGDSLRAGLAGWQAAVLSPSDQLLRALRLQSERKYKLHNGSIPVTLGLYEIASGQAERQGAGTDFSNRLHKNWQQRRKWANKEGVTAYRLYDADIPEFNAAIDWYDGQVLVQEYAPPGQVPAAKSEQRWFDILTGILQVLPVRPDCIHTRQRRRQKGKSQYEVEARADSWHQVQEYNARFHVNLGRYLDTGLFLDHRLVRQQIQQLSAGQRVLNLFAYTGAASVHAALGQASQVTTIDMSRTYLNWAKDNFRLNQLTLHRHEFIQADCLQWLIEQSEGDRQWDLIFLDPPTFSNSKRMAAAFDVQRDHGDLLAATASLLAPGGKLIFSTNKRRFQLDSDAVAAAGLTARDHSKASIPTDFKAQRLIHYCWVMQPRSKSLTDQGADETDD